MPNSIITTQIYLIYISFSYLIQFQLFTISRYHVSDGHMTGPPLLEEMGGVSSCKLHRANMADNSRQRHRELLQAGGCNEITTMTCDSQSNRKLKKNALYSLIYSCVEGCFLGSAYYINL